MSELNALNGLYSINQKIYFYVKYQDDIVISAATKQLANHTHYTVDQIQLQICLALFAALKSLHICIAKNSKTSKIMFTIPLKIEEYKQIWHLISSDKITWMDNFNKNISIQTYTKLENASYYCRLQCQNNAE